MLNSGQLEQMQAETSTLWNYGQILPHTVWAQTLKQYPKLLLEEELTLTKL